MTPQQLAEKDIDLNELSYQYSKHRFLPSIVPTVRTVFEEAFIKGYEANQSLKEAKVFRICSHCNTEFELTMGQTTKEKVCSFISCTHCGKRNDVWISIKISTS